MAEDITTAEPVVADATQQPAPVPYVDKVYAALKDNLVGFKKTPEEFKTAMQDSAYASKAYQALKDNLTGFDKTPDAFYEQVGIKKKQSTPVSANTVPPSFTGGITDQSSLIGGNSGANQFTPVTDPSLKQNLQNQQALDIAHNQNKAIDKANRAEMAKTTVLQNAQAIGQKHATVQQPADTKGRSWMEDIQQGLYLPAFNKGFNDLVVKPLAGGTDLVDRTIDKIYTGLTGDKTPQWLRKGGAFDKVATYYDKAYQERDKPSNILSETAEGVVGTLPLIASLATGQGEASMAAKTPQLVSKLTGLLATTKAATAYKDATDQHKDYVTSLNDAATGALKGGVEGLTMEAQMMLGGALGKGVVNKLAEKGLLKGGKTAEALLHAVGVGTVFGGTSAGEDLLNGKDIDVHEAMKQFGTGLAFELPGVAKGLHADVKDAVDSKKVNDGALQVAAASSAASNLNGESVLRTLMNTPKDQLTAINDNIKDGHEDLYADSIEMGTKAYDAKDTAEKKRLYADQLVLKTQGDVKLIADKVSKDPQAFIDTITNSDEIPDEQKAELIDKVQSLTKTKPNEAPIPPVSEGQVSLPETPSPTEQPNVPVVADPTNETPIQPIANEPPTTNSETAPDVQGQSEQQVSAPSNSEAPVETPVKEKRNRVSDADAPKLKELAHNLPETGKEGISIEPAFKKDNKGNFTDEPLDNGTKQVVSRGKDGKVNGVLEISYNNRDGEQKEPVSVKVVVDEADRRKGIATALFKHAEDNGIDLKDVRGKETTDAGQALYEASKKEPELSHEDAIRQSIEKETDPKKIAAQYHTETSYPDHIEKGIIDYLGDSKINEKDYKRITGNDAPHGGISRWIDTKNSDKTDINTHAEIISHDLGVHVTPEDIVETIDRYTGRKNFIEANKSDTQKLLESRYEELTGKKLTARRAEKAHGSLAKELTPAQVEEFNKHAKEIGITQEDIDNYERARKQSDRGADKPRDAKPAKNKVQQPSNEQGGRPKESDGGKGVESKAGDPIRSFAEKVRNGKINKLGGFKASTGFDAVWDGSLEVVAKSLETGAKVADAIEAGLKHVKSTDWYKSLTDKEKFDEQYRNHLTNEYTEHEKTLPTKNEVTNERAADLGIELKDTKNGKRGADKIDVDATAEIDKGYDTPDLIDRILNEGHQASDTEIAILGKYMDAKEAEIKTQNERLAKDGATMSKKQFDELTEANTQSLSEFQDAAQADRKTGTETARALSARKLSFNKEATLANMIVAKRQANGNNKLSPEQLAEVQKTHAELESIQEALQKKIARLEEDNAKLKANQSVRKAADRIKRKSISKDELKAERTKIFDSIRDEFAKIRKSGQAMSDIPYRRELAAIAKHMPALLRNLAQEGLVEIKDVVDRIHEEFKGDIEGLTKRDVTDLIAGKYDEVKPTKKEILTDISSLKTQAKLLNEIEDLQNGIKKAKPESANAKKKNEQVEALRGRLKELNKENEPTADEKKLEAYKKRIQENIEKLTQRLANEDYEKGEKPKPLTLDAEGLELRRKYDRIKNDFDIEVAKDALKQRSKTEKLKDDLLNIASLPRALKASLDFSAVLRQGLFATVNHPVQALHAFTEMFKQTFSEEKYRNWISDLKHSENYELMKDSELYLSDKDDPKIIAREEEFTSNLADKIPGIGKLIAASERAYTGYLNVLRAGVFEQQARELIKRGYTFENNPEVFKGVAKVVNVLTGRGDIPEAFGGKQPKVLSNVLFSPRFMAARIQTLYLWADPRLPKEAKVMAAKDIGATLAVGSVLLSLAAMAGLKVVTDPRSSNFLKIEDKQKNGSTFYDILGGLPQYVRLLSQMASGQKVPASGNGVIDLTTGKYGKPSRLSLATSFMRGKLSPLIGSGVNLMEGKDVVGQPYHFWPNVPQEFVPLPFTDVQEAYQVGGIKNALKAFLPSQFGISTSSYNPNAKIKKK